MKMTNNSLISDSEIRKVHRNSFVVRCCKEFGLENFRLTIEEIAKKITDAGCKISLDVSYNVKAIYYDDNKCIYINPSFRSEGINTIWRILHEFGHYLDNTVHKNEILNREIEAWRIAELEMEKFPQLREHKVEFLEFKQACLNSYANKIIRA